MHSQNTLTHKSHLHTLCSSASRREREALGGRVRLRLLLTRGQVGAVMGRKGSTVK